MFADETVPGRLIETFLVGSWEEHERQHARLTNQDARQLDQLESLLIPGAQRVAHHYIAAKQPRTPLRSATPKP